MSLMLCQICGGSPKTLFLKEGNVSCGDYFEGRRLYEVDLGEIALLECTDCGFGYFPEMQTWPEEKYRAEIYNEDYHLCDPPFLDERPRRLAAWLDDNLQPCDLIDYGGGEGRLADLLVEKGFRALSYDPFYRDPTFPDRDADVVTAFEVIEHVPDQRALFRTLKSLCRPGGAIIFSTSLKRRCLEQDWWYASARSGHVSLHTADSLKQVMIHLDLKSVSLSNELHVAASNAGTLARFETWRPVSVCDTPTFIFSDGWRRMMPCLAAEK